MCQAIELANGSGSESLAGRKHSDGLLIGAIAVVLALAFLRHSVAATVSRAMLNRAPALWCTLAICRGGRMGRVVTNPLEQRSADAGSSAALGRRNSRCRSRRRPSIGLPLESKPERGFPMRSKGLPQFGATIKPFLAWGEEHSLLPEALDAIASMAIAAIAASGRFDQGDRAARGVSRGDRSHSVHGSIAGTSDQGGRIMALVGSTCVSRVPAPNCRLPLPVFLGRSESCCCLVVSCSSRSELSIVGRKPPADATAGFDAAGGLAAAGHRNPRHVARCVRRNGIDSLADWDWLLGRGRLSLPTLAAVDAIETPGHSQPIAECRSSRPFARWRRKRAGRSIGDRPRLPTAWPRGCLWPWRSKRTARRCRR